MNITLFVVLSSSLSTRERCFIERVDIVRPWIIMRRPKWLAGWGKGKNPFEGSLIVDIPEIKVVEASFNNKLALFAVGILGKNEQTVSSGVEAEEIQTKYEIDMYWKIFYDPTALPKSIPLGKAKDFMAGAVALISGSSSVYGSETLYIVSGNRPSKGNAPLLLDYEIARKIEEAKEKKN